MLILQVIIVFAGIAVVIGAFYIAGTEIARKYQEQKKKIKLGRWVKRFKEVRLLKKTVSNYIKFVSEQGDKLPYGIAEETLPYPKDEIQHSIEKLYSIYAKKSKIGKTWKAKEYLDTLEKNYAALGSFLPEKDIEFHPPLLDPSYEELEAFLLYSQQISECQKRYIERLRKLGHLNS